MTSTALLTDHYELTMLQAALAAGTARRRAVFELFPRRLPEGRRYGVVAGVGRMLDALADFCFGPAEIDFLRREQVVDEPTLDWLASYRFSGDIWGYPEGEVYFPYSPLLIVEGSFAEAGINTEMDFGPKQSRLLDEHIRLKNDFSALQRRYDDAIVEKQNLLGQLTGEKSTLEREKALRAEAEAEAEMLRGRRRELEAKILSLSIEKAKLEQSALLAKIDALNASLSDVMSNPVDAAAPPPERR